MNNFTTLVFMRNRGLATIRFTILLPVLPLMFTIGNLVGLVLDHLGRDGAFGFNHFLVASRAA